MNTPPDPSYVIKNTGIVDTIGNILTTPGSKILQLFLSNFISLAIGVAGIAAFIYLLIGGYQYLASGGDKEGAQKASKTITSALTGLAIVLSIFAIIYVVETLFGLSISIFKIPIIE